MLVRDTLEKFQRLSVRALLLLVAACFAFAAPAFAQTITTGDIAGIVKDASGAVVPNAKITLKSSDTGEVRNLVTGPSGDYRFTLLKPVRLNVTAYVPGRRSTMRY